MSDGTDNKGVVIAVSVAAVLILFIATVGIGSFIIFSRQKIALVSQERQAQAAEMEALRNLQQAITFEKLESARSTTLLAASEKANQSVAAAIESIILAQVTAWNSGKIDEFMEHYWKSDELTFSSGGKTTRGWTATRNHYHEKYPTPEKMGKLTIDGLEVKELGDTAALVLGKWKLEREAEPLAGNFSLVASKIDGQWRIIHDHTSLLAE